MVASGTRSWACVEVDQPAHPIGPGRREAGEFVAGDGMANQNRAIDPQAVQHDADVVAERIDLVAAGRLTRCAESSPGEREDMELPGPLRGEIVELVAGIVQPREKQHRRSAPTPIENLEPDTGPRVHESHPMG